MKAWQFTAYGHGPVLREVAEPAVGPGEVLVRVAGAALNPLDVKIGAGLVRDRGPLARRAQAGRAADQPALAAGRRPCRGPRAACAVPLALRRCRPARIAAPADDGLRIVVDRTVVLSDAAEAFGYLAGGHTKGKVIVRP